MVLASPIEGFPNGVWDEFETKIIESGDETGGWEFEVEFETSNLELSTYEVVLPGDTLFLFYDTQTSEDWHYYQSYIPTTGYKTPLITEC